jgi:membrane-bound serine protease (ClpP class)
MWFLAFICIMAGIVAFAVGFVWLLSKRFTSDELERGSMWVACFPGPQIEWLADRLLPNLGETVGVERLIGAEGQVLSSGSESARVHIRGEIWQAASASSLVIEQRVRVVAVDGLVLRVEPYDGDTSRH